MAKDEQRDEDLLTKDAQSDSEASTLAFGSGGAGSGSDDVHGRAKKDSGTGTRAYGSMLQWLDESMAPWYHGVMARSYYGTM